MFGIIYSATVILINVEIYHLCLRGILEDFLWANTEFYFTWDFTLPSVALLCRSSFHTVILVISISILIQVYISHTCSAAGRGNCYVLNYCRGTQPSAWVEETCKPLLTPLETGFTAATNAVVVPG